jgi:hypothetical protein
MSIEHELGVVPFGTLDLPDLEFQLNMVVEQLQLTVDFSYKSWLMDAFH